MRKAAVDWAEPSNGAHVLDSKWASDGAWVGVHEARRWPKEKPQDSLVGVYLYNDIQGICLSCHKGKDVKWNPCE